ncbi:ImmA/IrrE family metallo-endopeptidase [Paenibacillus sp. N3.4]|uniref:ImmA/IrrE family metallo-endopeptidase n=1 Tax=Paenibacillus sp. N3.4 TaxID=2603222 RepID=UPI0011CB8A0D|nr:ImmA/IrrE family metallo-endopeptidase [Paenibacillus sp. N3.4]TXK82613.1 ImmA/IrrE family metallo-endopeptidase [Paenibacillus sp. N3.4]
MHEKTKKLIRKFKTNDPFLIAEGLNINIRYAKFEDGTRGLYYKVLRQKFIVLHEDLSEAWKRFICAHEIGHDRLHPGLSRFWLDEHSISNPGKYEREANQFAANLLIPDALLLNGMTIYEAAAVCGVPEEVAHLKQRPQPKRNIWKNEDSHFSL